MLNHESVIIKALDMILYWNTIFLHTKVYKLRKIHSLYCQQSILLGYAKDEITLSNSFQHYYLSLALLHAFQLSL